MVVRKRPRAPEGIEARLDLGEHAERVRLFVKAGESFELFDESTVFASADIRQGVELAIEARDLVRDAELWDGFVDLTLVATRAGERHEDVVRLRVAPLVTSHHLQPATHALASDTQLRDGEPFLRDLEAAVRALLGHSAVVGAHVGAVGFCMGGQLALFAATRSARIGAVVDFYGIHPNVSLDLSGLSAAVLGVFAERDEFVPPDAARKLEAELRGAGKRARFEIYPGVDHAFFNDSRPDVYDARAAARAWSETLAFLRAELA